MNYSSILIIILIIAIIFFKRFEKARLKQKKKVTMFSLLIIPIIYLFVFSNTFISMFSMSGYLNLCFLLAALLLGILVGFIRSKFYKLTVDYDTNSVYYIPTIIDFVIFIVLIAIKVLGEIVLSQFIHGNILLISVNSLILFSVSSIITRRIIVIFKYLIIIFKFKDKI